VRDEPLLLWVPCEPPEDLRLDDEERCVSALLLWVRCETCEPARVEEETRLDEPLYACPCTPGRPLSSALTTLGVGDA